MKKRRNAQKFFRFYPSDWLNGTFMMSPDELALYITLIAMMHDRGGPVTEELLRYRFKGMRMRDFRKALDALIESGNIIDGEGGLRNERVMIDLEEIDQSLTTPRANGEPITSHSTSQSRTKAEGKNPEITKDVVHPKNDHHIHNHIHIQKTSSIEGGGFAAEGVLREKARGVSPDLSRRPTFDEVDTALRKIPGVEKHPIFVNCVTSPIWQLVEAGISLDAVVVPVITRILSKHRGQPIHSWEYFVNAILGSTRTKSTVAPLAQITDDKWKRNLKAARSLKIWDDKWGPRPFEKGCLVPQNILEEGDGDGWQSWEDWKKEHHRHAQA